MVDFDVVLLSAEILVWKTWILTFRAGVHPLFGRFNSACLYKVIGNRKCGRPNGQGLPFLLLQFWVGVGPGVCFGRGPDVLVGPLGRPE